MTSLSTPNKVLPKFAADEDELERDPKAPVIMHVDVDEIVQTEDLFKKGSLLHLVQVNKVLHDGKEFVDRPALVSPFTIVEKWNYLLSTSPNGLPKNEEILSFLEENFGKSGGELEDINIDELNIFPKYLTGIRNHGLIRLGTEIQEVWTELGKQVKKEVLVHPSRTSILYLPKPFIIPGGRFKEIYYWDTYWVVKSLLRSGATYTTKGILQNYFHLIDKYGFIPNGNRNYYLDRSQPPLFIHMVNDYIHFTKNVSILENIDLLIKEMSWFEKNRMIKVTTGSGTFSMFRYSTNGSGPRPESYLEDLEAVEHGDFATEEEKEALLQHIQAAAESGWDFSVRWLIDANGGCSGGMENTRAMFIIPVDLNAIMYKNYVILSGFLSSLGRSLESSVYRDKAECLKSAVMQVLFEPETATWRDYDLLNKKQRDFYFASNIFPLWTGCYPADRAEELGEAAAHYLVSQNAIRPGGIITSNIKSGLQWDAPNCWPPLQEMAVTGLRNTGSAEAWNVAQSIARNFTKSVLVNCTEDECEFYEKYDAESGSAGAGGEYAVQKGFGWTNAVIVEFIALYKDDLLDDATKEDIVKNHTFAPGWLQFGFGRTDQFKSQNSTSEAVGRK